MFLVEAQPLVLEEYSAGVQLPLDSQNRVNGTSSITQESKSSCRCFRVRT